MAMLFPHKPKLEKMAFNKDDAAPKSIKRVMNPADAMSDIYENLPNASTALESDTSLNRSDISIPSPWATVLSMDAILFSGEEYGVFAKFTLAEWRTLLTLIALEPLMNFGIQMNEISLENPVNPAEREFYSTLLGLSPVNHIFENNDCWKKVYLLELNSEAERKKYMLGLLSNSTLVCSASGSATSDVKAHLEKCGAVGLVTMEAGSYVFNDPIKFIVSDDIRCVYMYSWLRTAEKALAKVVSVSDSPGFRGKIMKKLTEFANDIAKAFQKGSLDSYTLIDFVKVIHPAAEDGQKKPVPDVKTFFDQFAVEFDFTTDYIRDIMKPVNMNFYYAGRLSPQLKNLYDNPAYQSPTGRIRVKKDKVALLNDKDIFMDKLYIIYWLINDNQGLSYNELDQKARALAENSAPHLHFLSQKYQVYLSDDEPRSACCCALWPIKSSFLESVKLGNVSPQELKQKSLKLGVLDGVEDAFKISVDFTFIDGQVLTREHTYSESANQVVYIDAGSMPYLSLWPYAKIMSTDFNNPNDPQEVNTWHNYYVYESRRVDSDTQYNAVMGNSNPQLTSVLTLLNTNEMERQIKKYTELPTHAIINRIKNGVSEEIGSIIFNPPEIFRRGAERKCILGLDFGTTSTTLFYKVDRVSANDAQFVKLGKTYLFDKINLSEKKVDSESNQKIVRSTIFMTPGSELEAGKFFVPDTFYKRYGYASVYQETSGNSNAGNLLTEMLLLGNILFENDDRIGNVNSVVDNEMKWGDSVKTNEHKKGYLRQILAMTAFSLSAYENINSITVRASYPTSLSMHELTNLQNIINGVINQLNNEHLGVAFKREMDYTYYTESIVAAKAISASATNFYACVDIGGGSTDISAWYRITGANIPANLFQTSVQMASREMFLTPLSELIISSSLSKTNRSALQNQIIALRKTEYSKALDTAIDTMGESPNYNDRFEASHSFGLKMESAIFQYSDSIQKYIEDGRVNNEHKYRFTRRLTAGMFSLFYYTVKSLAAEKKHRPDIYDETTTTTLTIYLAGNGARMYSWISEVMLKNMAKVLTEIAVEEHLITENGKVEIKRPNADRLKTEAATGLTMMDVDEMAGESNIRVYSGEKIFFKRKDGSLKESDPDTDFYNDEEIKQYFENTNGDRGNIVEPKLDPNSLDSLKEFIKIANEKVFKNDPSYMINIKDTLNDIYNAADNNIKDACENERITSTFVAIIQALLKNI